MSYAAEVTVTCDNGYILPSNDSATTTTCLATGLWNVTQELLRCQGNQMDLSLLELI